MSTCRELVESTRLANRANLRRYDWLHPEGRQLIRGWFERGWSMRDCTPDDSFEPFIFTWISFNGWAACVTQLDRDRDWLDAIILSEEICDDFNRLITDREFPLSTYSNEFYHMLPIFKAQEIRQQGIRIRGTDNRREVVERYFTAGIRQFQPQCWSRHQEKGSHVPLDWAHTLAALYRVRCNLFHGEKAAHSEMDRRIVGSAFRVLIHFIAGARYIVQGNT